MPQHLPLSAGDFSLPQVAPGDPLTKWDPKSKHPLSPWPIALPRTPQPALPMTNAAHCPLGPPGPTGALLPQDPFRGSPMLTPSMTSQPW
jgi:hypothetical protein